MAKRSPSRNHPNHKKDPHPGWLALVTSLDAALNAPVDPDLEAARNAPIRKMQDDNLVLIASLPAKTRAGVIAQLEAALRYTTNNYAEGMLMLAIDHLRSMDR